VRIVIADDSLLVREGIASLQRRAGFDVVAEAGSGDELLELVDTLAPELALVDVRMPPTHTRRACTRRARFVPGIRRSAS
jgi:DNA-binding NarL/FixJ family response regulator